MTQDEMIHRARALRNDQTLAEKRLWSKLRHRQILGCKFRRQHPTGSHIADFVCLSRRVIIELDGGQHATTSEEGRTEVLVRKGFLVLRFWNHRIFENLDGVVETIRGHLARRADGHSNSEGQKLRFQA